MTATLILLDNGATSLAEIFALLKQRKSSYQKG